MIVRQLYEEYISVRKNEVRETILCKTEECLKYYVLAILEDVRIDKSCKNGKYLMIRMRE